MSRALGERGRWASERRARGTQAGTKGSRARAERRRAWGQTLREARRGAGGGRAGGRRAGRRQRRPGRAQQGRSRRAAWALDARAGQSCALGALGLFLAQFDSVFFMSQFLDIVREPGS